MNRVHLIRSGFRVADWLVYGLSVAVLAFLIVWAGEGSLSRLASPEWPYVVGIFVFTYLFMESLTFRYAAILRFLYGEKVPPHLSILSGTAFGMTSGLIVSRSIGQILAKPGLLRNHHGFPLSHGIYASFLERLMDLATSVVLACPFLVKAASGAEPFPGFFLLFFGALSVAWIIWTIPRLSFLLEKVHKLVIRLIDLTSAIPWISLKRVTARLHQVDPALLQGKHSQSSLGAGFVIWTVLKVVLMSFRMFLFGKAFSVSIPWEYFLLGVPIIQLSLLFAFTPGSLGFLEAGWFAVLSLQGVASESILPLLLALRVANYLFFPLVSICVWTFERVRLKHRQSLISSV